jgi:hypothetical protein
MDSNRQSELTAVQLQPDDELQLWAISAGASSLIVDLEPYEAARVAGSVIKLRIDPIAGDIDAYVWDGTAYLIARWHIVRPTPQLVVVPGRRILLTGTSVRQDEGVVMVEPLFELMEPEVAA